MSLSVQIGLLFALATAFCSIVGFLYKHRGAVETPAIEWRRPVRTSLVLFRSRWYVLGLVVATGSWGLHVTALSLAPISLVQSVIAGGLVLLTVTADRLFGFRVTRREWIGVALTATGLAFLAATMNGLGDGKHGDWESLPLATYVVTLTVLGLAATWASSDDERGGSVLAVAAGMLWGASDVSIKALSGQVGEGLGVLLHPLALVILTLSLVGLTVSARSLQLGQAVPVIAITSAAANTTTIAAGPLIFGEPLPDGALGITVRLLAFALVIAAASLTPVPVRAAEQIEPGIAPV
jgi:multidrug transporter EmrE-like cation transporter